MRLSGWPVVAILVTVCTVSTGASLLLPSRTSLAHFCDDNYKSEATRSACWWRYWNDQTTPQDRQNSSTVLPAPTPAATPQPDASTTGGDGTICNTYYTSQQDREDCWWRWHNGLPLIQSQQPTAVDKPSTLAPHSASCSLPSAGRQYLVNLNNLLDDTGIILTAIEYELARAGQTASLLFDQEWMLDILAHLTRLKQLKGDADNLHVPSIMYSVHLFIESAFDSYSLAANDYIDGIKNLDSISMALGNSHMDSGLYFLGLVKPALDNVCYAFGTDRPARTVQSTTIPQRSYKQPRNGGRNCTDFASRVQYEAFYAGRTKPGRHDRDKDGRYCENLS